MKSPEIQEKTRQTNLERYGGVAPACSEEVQNKMKETCIERYGIEHFSKTDYGRNNSRRIVNSNYNRDVVKELNKLRKQYGFKLPKGWGFKSEEFLKTLLEKIKQKYVENTLEKFF